MLGRILNNHSKIKIFNELHFFGQLWTSFDSKKKLTQEESVFLFSKLLCIQDQGIFTQVKVSNFHKESESFLQNKEFTSLEVFELFLEKLSIKNNSTISCEQTPSNVFYINEILENFPNAKIINMVRDPRDVLLSQKNKWKRRYLGALDIPLIESIRSYFNYHPITISKIWNSSINAAEKYKDNKRLYSVKYEDLLLNSKKELHDLCFFLGIDYCEKMLDIPNVGSSLSVDEVQNFGIDESKINKWKRGGLSKSEIYISQKMCSENMRLFNYKSNYQIAIPLLIFIYLITFPIKIVVSFIFNFHRVRNFKELINKRILK